MRFSAALKRINDRNVYLIYIFIRQNPTRKIGNYLILKLLQPRLPVSYIMIYTVVDILSYDCNNMTMKSFPFWSFCNGNISKLPLARKGQLI